LRSMPTDCYTGRKTNRLIPAGRQSFALSQDRWAILALEFASPPGQQQNLCFWVRNLLTICQLARVAAESPSGRHDDQATRLLGKPTCATTVRTHRRGQKIRDLRIATLRGAGGVLASGASAS
jgi:hypothetical protein